MCARDNAVDATFPRRLLVTYACIRNSATVIVCTVLAHVTPLTVHVSIPVFAVKKLQEQLRTMS